MVKPINMTIFDSIKEDIDKGKYVNDQLLPSENTLVETFNTSRMTVRKALLKLINEGYIYSIPGKGYFVKKKEFNNYLLHYNEMEMYGEGSQEIRLLSVDIIKPNVDLAFNLRIQQNKRVVAIKRLLFIDSNEAIYDEKYIPYYSGIPIVEDEIHFSSFPEIISNKTSLFNMTKKLNIKIEKSNNEIKKALKLDVLQPVMIVEQFIYDEEMEPIGWGKTSFKLDYFELSAKLLLNK